MGSKGLCRISNSQYSDFVRDWMGIKKAVETVKVNEVIMKALLQKLKGAKKADGASKKPTRDTNSSRNRLTKEEEWGMSCNDALRTPIVSGYK